MTNDDLLFRHRVSLFARAGQVGVSQACRELGYHRSTYYRWRPRVERHGLEILRPRERRPPRMPNQIPTWLEQRILAFALGQPGFGARRIASDLALPMWGRLAISASGVANVLRRHGLSTRRRRLALVAGYAAPPAPPPRQIPEPRHLDAENPGDLVQFDCLCRPPQRRPRPGLAIHGHRRRELISVGGVAHHAAQPSCTPHLGVGPARGI